MKVRKNIVKHVNSTTKDPSLIIDDFEKKLSVDDRIQLRQKKMVSTNHMLYLEGKDLLLQEAEDSRRMWDEFGDFNIQHIEREKAMWVQIMERGGPESGGSGTSRNR